MLEAQMAPMRAAGQLRNSLSLGADSIAQKSSEILEGLSWWGGPSACAGLSGPPGKLAAVPIPSAQPDNSPTDDKQEKPSEDTAIGETREARVARTSSGNDHHNTLTPHWDFAFSV